jgi:hypothetical protein
MRSKIIEDLLIRMESDPWHIKLRRWWRLQVWVFICKTRFIWDLSYQHNIFRKK